MTALQDSLGPFDELAFFEFPFDFNGFLFEAGILFGQLVLIDGTAHLFADEAEEGDFLGRMFVAVAVMDVDNADQIAARNERDRQERIVGIFHEGPEAFEPLVLRSI